MSSRPNGMVQVGAVQVNGGLASEVVARVLRSQLARFRFCYESGLQRNPSLAGRVSVRFLVTQSGQVGSAVDAGSSRRRLDRRGVRARPAPRDDVSEPRRGFHGGHGAVHASPRRGAFGGAAHAVVRAVGHPSRVRRRVAHQGRRRADQAPSSGRSESVEPAPLRGPRPRAPRAWPFRRGLAAARRFVSLDPDLPVARELLAYAAVTNDDPALAAASIDTQTETDPTSVKWHVRGARSFEALGDERRACAHWRSLVELSPKSDEFAYEALRCRGPHPRRSRLARRRAIPRAVEQASRRPRRRKSSSANRPRSQRAPRAPVNSRPR